MLKKHIEITEIDIKCESAEPSSHFRFSLALCAKTTAYFFTKNIRLIKLSLSSSLTNVQGPSSIIKGIFGHFYLQKIIQNFGAIFTKASCLQCILGKCTFISSSKSHITCKCNVLQ